MKVKFLLGVTLISVALVGCGQKSSNTGNVLAVQQNIDVGNVVQNLRLNLSKVPETIDPQLNHEGESSLIINNLYEGLMRQVGDEIVSGIAESYTVSEDGLTYTFMLREGCWSDGVEITAMDFEYAWRRGADPLTGSPHLGDYEAAKIKNAGAIARGEMSTASLGVLALDTHVLEVTLEEPNEAFLDYMTLESFMPLREDIVDEAGNWSKTNAVYNGPFKIASFNEQGITLEKNESYWNAKNVYLQNVDMKIVGDAEVAESQYLKNELDMLIAKTNWVDANNIVLTPKEVVEEDKAQEKEQGKAKNQDETVDTDQVTEQAQGENKEASLEEVELVEENDTAIKEGGDFLVHSWVSGWRTNLQGLLWLGNAYIEEH